MPSNVSVDATKIQKLKDIANKLRIDSIASTHASNSGHPTSCCSIAEIMSVLFFHQMKYRVDKPKHASNDRFVLSKGHAAPILYAAWAEAGLFPREDLMNLRKIYSDLEGHPTPRLNFIDVATGSLGQGLSIACGMAYTGKYFDKASYRVYCIVGDGESAEGSIWEALHFGSLYKLDNLVTIIDVNRLGQSEATSLQHQMDVYKARLEAFGWNTYVIDGHSVEDIITALAKAETCKDKPTCLLLKTFKGKGIEGVENLDNWHGKPMAKKTEEAIKHIKSKIIDPLAHIDPLYPTDTTQDVDITNIKLESPPDYKIGELIATRVAYGKGLPKLGANNKRVVAMDGDTKNSTYSIFFKEQFPERFIECFIAEQNLVGVAIGCACRDRTVAFVSTFAAFLSRAYDQIRMGAISQTNVNFVGSHCGISIGEDGASQMALEDIAMFRAIPGSTVFYPSDAVSCERALELSANTKGVCFVRTSRPPTAIMYENNHVFKIGQAKVFNESEDDVITFIGAGVTFHEALGAAKILLKEHNIKARVIDPFTIKPLDKATILKCGIKTRLILTVEDHYYEGGIGEATASLVADRTDIILRRMAVKEIPRSAKCQELLDMFEISSAAIVKHTLAFIAEFK